MAQEEWVIELAEEFPMCPAKPEENCECEGAIAAVHVRQLRALLAELNGEAG